MYTCSLHTCDHIKLFVKLTFIVVGFVEVGGSAWIEHRLYTITNETIHIYI